MQNSKGNIEFNLILKSDKFKSESDKAKDKLDKIRRAAYSANLSLMFAGAAMQRISQSIASFGTKAYDDISHSIVGTVTANDRLAGSMTMLGFSVGEALQPLIEMLIPIVETITEWVEANPELLAGIVAVMAVLGTLLTYGAGIKLFVMSFSGISATIECITASITALSGLLGVSLLPLFGIIVGALILLYAMWTTNFGGMRDFFIDTFGVLWTGIKQIFNDIWKIIKTVIDLVVAIFQGDWDKVLKLTGDLLKGLWKLFMDGLISIGVIILNIMAFAWNLVVDIVLKIFVGLITKIQSLFLDGILWVIDKIQSVAAKAHITIPGLEAAENFISNLKTGIDEVNTKAAQAATTLHASYINSGQLQTEFGTVSSSLGLGGNTTSNTTNSNTTNNVTINVSGDNSLNNTLKAKGLYGV